MNVPFAMLRHGPTDWNGARRLQGQTDTLLNPAGETLVAGWRLPAPADGWTRVSSPLRRAWRTAELMRPMAPVIVDSRLREMSFGAWEGRTVAELRATAGESFIAAERLGLDFEPPGGESPRAVMARLAGWTAEVARRGEPVVAVAHKAVLRAVLASATGWDMSGPAPARLDWHAVHFFLAGADGAVAVDRLNVPMAEQP